MLLLPKGGQFLGFLFADGGDLLLDLFLGFAKAFFLFFFLSLQGFAGGGLGAGDFFGRVGRSSGGGDRFFFGGLLFLFFGGLFLLCLEQFGCFFGSAGSLRLDEFGQFRYDRFLGLFLEEISVGKGLDAASELDASGVVVEEFLVGDEFGLDLFVGLFQGFGGGVGLGAGRG